MDFFESQDVARRKTGRLVLFFVVAIVVMDALLYGAVILVLTKLQSGDANVTIDAWQPGVLLIVTAALLAIIAMGSGLKTFELRGGGRTVAEMLGGKRLAPNTTDRAQRRLLNIVEEMALASGMPVPPVYLLEKERGINAFAAGYTPGDAVIGVNQGTIDHLNRDELQGVVAHEFSHILNGDMRLNLRLVGILHGIQLLGLIGRFIIDIFGRTSRRRSSNEKSDGAGAILFIGFAAFVIGYVGLFFGRLIKSAISRQREYLADASAVQFTRDSNGIGGALKKIGGHKLGSRIKSPEAEVASHMFFGSAVRFSAHGVFATHPPLAERVQRIDPQFDGTFAPVEPLPEAIKEREQAQKTEREQKARRRHALDALPIPGARDHSVINAALVLASVGQPTTSHVERAADLVETIPEHITSAAHDPYSARAVVFATLLDKDEEIRRQQIAMISRQAGQEMADLTGKLRSDFDQLDPATRLPLIQIVQGTLHDLAPAQYHDFRRLVQALIAADRRVSLLEFVMQRLVLLRLDRHFGNRKPPRATFYSIRGLVEESTVLLSMLAHAGHRDQSDATNAFVQAVAVLFPQRATAQLLSRNECQVPKLHAVLDKFEKATPPIKQLLLKAVAVSVATDGEVNIAEAELMRAIADSLDCPIPLPQTEAAPTVSTRNDSVSPRS